MCQIRAGFLLYLQRDYGEKSVYMFDNDGSKRINTTD